MASPRLLAICQPVARCLEQRDGAGLVTLLTPFADDPELDDAIAAIAAAFPQLRGRPVPSHWPANREDRCVAVLAAAIARPRDDTALANAAVRPTSWNWLTSLRDVLAGRDPSAIGDIHAALEAAEFDGAADLLDALPQAAARQGWQALLVSASLAGQASMRSVDRAMQAVLASIATGHTDVPGSVAAVALAQLAHRRVAPSDALCARVRALPPGISRDLVTAAALTAWSDAGPLAADALSRIAIEQNRVVWRASETGKAWLDLLGHLVDEQPAGCASLLGTPHEPGYVEAARDTLALGSAAVTAKMPITARMAAVLLRRLRRADLADLVAQRPQAETAHLAAMLMPASVLTAIEKPRPATERAARLLAEADAATIGRPVGAPSSQIASSAVSICIVTHNQATSTVRLLTSLARLWPDFHGDVLLFDNGSIATDFDYLVRHAARFWPGRLRLLRSETNMGPGPARNLLFAEVRTDWILSLDNDMIAIDDIGQRLLPAAAASGAAVFNLAYEELDHPGVAGVGKSWRIDDDGASGKVFQTGFAAWTTTGRAEAPTLVAANRLSGGASFLRASVFRELGGFVADNVIGYEDYEFSLRLAGRGHAIETLSRPLLVHGHMAPARVTDLAAVAGRFNQTQMAASTQAFADVLAMRFGAHLGERGVTRPPHRVVPRRLDLRHADGRGFFELLHPRGKLVGLLLDETMMAAAPAVAEWLAARRVNVEIRHVSEFNEMEQALLVLQACDVIVAAPSFRALSTERCRAMGLTWPVGDLGTPAVIVLDAGRGNADSVVAAIAARL